MKHQSYKYIAVILSALFFQSCKKFVTIDAPYTSTLSKLVFTDPVTATGAQTNIYSQLVTNSMPYIIARRTGEYADELTNYATGLPSVPYYTNSLQAPNANILWTNFYKYIYAANSVIEGLQESNTISPIVKTQLIGEAKFTRAFLNFNLVNMHGDIPLLLTTNYSANAIAPRTSAAQVYSQIITDCKDAVNTLNSNFVDASDTTVTTERIRPTKWAAEALLARVYLYTGDYANAEAMASAVIGNTALFSLNTQLSQVFLANSTESIWQLQNLSNYYYVTEGFFFPIRTGLITYSEQGASSYLSPQLLNAFESGDQRKTIWTATYTSGSNTYYYPNKYQYVGFTSPPTPFAQYSTVLRLAEQFLIRGEARAQQGNTAGALSDLNAIRNRAGLANYAGATDKASLLVAFLHERQVELFTEWGHRWFDLKRTGQADAVMNVVSPLKGGIWSPYKQLWPILSSDLTNDPNLTQNPGY